MSRLKRLIVEIHDRSLWQVLLVYVGAAWACFELIDAVTSRLGLPPWLPGLAIVLFLLGLPFVVATALVREVAGPAAARPDVRESLQLVADAFRLSAHVVRLDPTGATWSRVRRTRCVRTQRSGFFHLTRA